jgi:hypothetical protein
MGSDNRETGTGDGEWQPGNRNKRWEIATGKQEQVMGSEPGTRNT